MVDSTIASASVIAAAIAVGKGDGVGDGEERFGLFLFEFVVDAGVVLALNITVGL